MSMTLERMGTGTKAAIGDIPQTALSATSPTGLRWPAFVTGAALALLLYWPTTVSFPERWSGDPTYSHGYLVALVAAWMAWRTWRRGELEGTTPSRLALIPLAFAGVLWLLAQGASIVVVQQWLLPTLLLGLAWALFGWRGLWRLFPALGVLYLVVPVWEILRPPLQEMTTFAVGRVMTASGIPVHLEGNFVHLPAGSFEIALGCSGLNVFLAGAALAWIQAFAFLGAAWARALLIGAALAACVIANWLRVAIIVIAGHLTDMQHWLIEDHYQFGWVTFAIMMAPVLYLGYRLERTAPLPPAPAPRPAWSLSGAPRGGRLPAATLAILAVPGLAWWSVSAAGQVAPPPQLPAAAGGWHKAGPASPDWRPVHDGHELELSAQYSDGARAVDVWVVYYPRQTRGRELITGSNALARPYDGRLSAAGSGPGALRLETGRRHDRLIWYRYEIGGRVARSTAQAKLYQLAGTLSGHPSGYGVFLSARCARSDCTGAQAALADFAVDFRGLLPGLAGD